MKRVTDLCAARAEREKREVAHAKRQEEDALDSIAERLDRIVKEINGLNADLFTIQTARGGLDQVTLNAFRELEYFTLDLWVGLGEDWDLLHERYVDGKMRRSAATPNGPWFPNGYRKVGQYWERVEPKQP